jgi:1-acyl-sn-glycerol-3-phosphate acyltransferase
MELRQIRFIRSTFDEGRVQSVIPFLQRTLGVWWIHHCTKHLTRLHGLERLPKLDKRQSFIFVANHRSFFDLYVVTAYLIKHGMQQRIVFPVRANFFYDSYPGLLVNGIMSFFAMYPPLFRDRSKAAVNVASLKELSWLIRRGGAFVGMHPEGTRNTGSDPYTLLEAQPGVGKVIRDANVPVIPIFINGLVNDFKRQVTSNFDRTGQPVYVVFGEPVELGDLVRQKASPRLHREISARCLSAIAKLGEEERALRASAGDAVVPLD